MTAERWGRGCSVGSGGVGLFFGSVVHWIIMSGLRLEFVLKGKKGLSDRKVSNT